MADTLVWISGASSGLGRALADTVPWSPARVIDFSRSGHAGIEHVAADLADPDGWEAAAASFAKELESFDGTRAVFVHCAGTLTPIGFAGEVDAIAYRREVLLNSASPQILGDAFIRALGGRDVDAHIVMISSGAATSAYAGWSGYGPAKAAVDHWVRTVGDERARRAADGTAARCRVVAVAPGVVATAMQEEIRSTDERDFPNVERFHRLHESGELTAPEDAARGVWSLFDRDLDNGAVVDLRDLT